MYYRYYPHVPTRNTSTQNIATAQKHPFPDDWLVEDESREVEEVVAEEPDVEELGEERDSPDE